MGEVIYLGPGKPDSQRVTIGFDPAEPGGDRTVVSTFGDGQAFAAPVEVSDVRMAARAIATQRMAVARLTPAQRKEALMLAGTILASCPDVRRIWQNKADHVALGASTSVTRRAGLQWSGPKSILSWLAFGVAFALAIHVTPVTWFLR